MKRLFLFSLFLLIINSCAWNDPTDDDVKTTLSSLTSSSQLSFVYFTSAEVSLYSGVIMQHVSGNSGTMLEISKYNLLPTYFDNPWNYCYLGVLSNLKSIIEIADENNYGKYSGIAKILMANTLGVATDLWGDIPFKENFISGSNSFEPNYDPQEELYEQIFILLDQGIDDLTIHGNDFYPTIDDLFFGGDPDRWIRYANFLKLRYNLHLNKRQGNINLLDIIDQPMFDLPGDKLKLRFSDLRTKNPIYSFLNSDVNQIKASSTFLEILNQMNDPRVSFYYKKNSEGNFVGIIPGDVNELASSLSDSIKSEGSRVILGSFTEQMFIQAEVYFMNNDPESSLQALEEAIRSSFIDYSISNDEWIENYLDGLELSLENIIEAKYIALFLQSEVWNDWRRTGFPQLIPPPTNSNGGVIPRRFSYPQSEFDFNPNNVPQGISITEGVWWDI